MILDIYKKALAVLKKRPVRLWGVSLLYAVLTMLAVFGFLGIPAVGLAISFALEASMAMIYLNSYRTGLQPKTEYLFTAFRKDRVVRVICGMAWMYLWIFLWSLIPIAGIVFGVIRAYEYSFTPYILMTRDDVKATEAIQISKQQTMGYKGKMFGAEILVSLAVGIALVVLHLFAHIPYVGVLFAMIAVLLHIAWALLGPLFLGLVAAAFYVQAHTAPAAPAATPAPAPTLPDAAPAEPAAQTEPEQPAPTPAAEGEEAATAAPPASQDEPSTPPRPAFCTSCGAPVQLDEKFCTRCGHKL